MRYWEYGVFEVVNSRQIVAFWLRLLTPGFSAEPQGRGRQSGGERMAVRLDVLDQSILEILILSNFCPCAHQASYLYLQCLGK